LNDLASHIGPALTYVVWYARTAKRFVSFFPDFSDDSPANKRVSGGEGYIVVMAKPATVTFVGKHKNLLFWVATILSIFCSNFTY